MGTSERYMKLYTIKADIRHIVGLVLKEFDSIYSNSFINSTINRITDSLYTNIEKEVNKKLQAELDKVNAIVFDGKTDKCYCQPLPMYYASNKGINETEYKICFKCRKVTKV